MSHAPHLNGFRLLPKSSSSEDGSSPSTPSSPSNTILVDTCQPPSFQKTTQILEELEKEFPVKFTNDASAAQEDCAAQPKFTKQIFFDCDNTLVNTESVAVEATATVINRCLSEHDIDAQYNVEELLVSYFGCTTREMLNTLQGVHRFELSPAEVAEYVVFEEDLVVELIHANPRPCSGIERVLEELHTTGQYTLSVVSSSPIRRIRAALDSADIAQYFAHDQVFSAKSSLSAPKSKPDPTIYKFAMEQNHVLPWECIAFEDSRSGARSAILAGIPCIAYVGAYGTMSHREQASKILEEEGCRAVMHNYTQFAGYLERTEVEIGKEVVEGTFDKILMQKERAEDFEIWLRKLVKENKVLRTNWTSIKAKLDQKLTTFQPANRTRAADETAQELAHR